MAERNSPGRAWEPAEVHGADAEPEPPSVGDLLRHLYDRRVRILTLFTALLLAGGVALGGWWLFGPRTVEGVVRLSFRGMEKHEYPSGRKFTVEDLRSPEILSRALEDAGLGAERRDLKEVYVGVDVVPLVPGEVQARWRRQDRDGVKREEYLPSEFEIEVHPEGFRDAERLRLFHALVRAYQGQAKYEQRAAVEPVAALTNLPPDELTGAYDYWDLPALFQEHAESLADHVRRMVEESQEFRDPDLNLSFRDLGRQLDTWSATRLEALRAFIHSAGLVKDRALMTRRLQERLADLERSAARARSEAEQTTRLLEVVERPRSLLAGPLTDKQGAPLVDVSALDRLVQSDYVGPVVRHVSELHEVAARLEATQARVRQEIDLLAKVEPRSPPVAPAALASLTTAAAQGLNEIVDRYARVLDRYLDAAITRDVTVQSGPIRTIVGPKPSAIALVIVLASAAIALLIVLLRG